MARRAGVVAASPLVVAAAVWAAVAIAVAAMGTAAAARIGEWIADPRAGLADASGAVLGIALPVVAAAAIAAVVAQLAQARALWIPRRKVAGAPALPGDARARGNRALREALFGAAFGGVAFGWLWVMAPRIAEGRIVLVAGFLVVLAVAWGVVGAVDLLVRVLERAAALRMSAVEQKEDARLAGADPRWRERRQAVARGVEPAAVAMKGASLLVLGDGIAVGVAWDAVRRPVPVRVAAGTDARATQLLGLARRYRVPVQRDAELARALADGGEGPVAEMHWPRLAEVVAAVRGS